MEPNPETRETNPVSTENPTAGSEVEATPPPTPPATFTEAERTRYSHLVTRFKEIEDYWFESVKILREIRDDRLYREKYVNFEDFCRKELRISRTNADRLCQTGAIAQRLATNVAKPEKEAHIRPLLRLESQDQQIEAFQTAVDRAKGKSLTGPMVQKAVAEILKASAVPAQGPKPPTKADVITQISRAVICELEKLNMNQLEAFKKDVEEFKASWIKDRQLEAAE